MQNQRRRNRIHYGVCVMKNERWFNYIILLLSFILAVLSLAIALTAKRELGLMRTSIEEELKEQIDLSLAASENKTDKRQNKIEKEIEALSEQYKYVCRDTNVRSIAHRGASDMAPENTLPAFRKAKELGFSSVETDVRFTSDNIPVCLHDGSVNRTSNGTGDIWNMTLDEVKALDFGAWKGNEFQGTTIPTFEEFLVFCKNVGLYPYVELKTGTAEQIRGLVDLVNRYGLRGKVSWISFDSSLLAAVRWYDDEARLGLLISEFSPAAVNEICWLRSGKNEVFLNSCVYSEWIVEECRNAKLPLEIWTINKKDQLSDMDPYITGVTSNCLVFGQYLYEKAMAEQ